MSSAKTVSPVKKLKKEQQQPQQGSSNGTADEEVIQSQADEGGEDPSILSDPEDYLEENESLDMNLTGGNQKVWLVKLPRYLMEKWSSQSEEQQGKQLGMVKIKKDSGTTGKLQVKLVLNNQQGKLDDIPQEYDIKILNTQVKNSYAFSEENLKKFKQELTEVSQMPEQPQLPTADSSKDAAKKKFVPRKKFKFFRVQKTGEDGQQVRKYIPFVKTIPKKTALMGKICHDCQIIPAKSDSKYGEIYMRRHNITQGPPRPKVTLLNEIPGVIQSNAGPSIKGSNTSVFLKSTIAKGKNEGRAIRMPKKDLLDLLFRLFEEYEYWSMKGLKERTRQPESYLKESLDSIANLIKKGPYTSKYNLKPEYRRLRDAERAARLGIDFTGDENQEEEEEDEEMEDVV
ncbi:Transcription initiation factor IIF subunit beta [Spathaspora sp. JA1]|nr:Transcription initiation factor IIF subunit beta [Spathaspora sp. JA1]